MQSFYEYNPIREPTAAAVAAAQALITSSFSTYLAPIIGSATVTTAASAAGYSQLQTASCSPGATKNDAVLVSLADTPPCSGQLDGSDPRPRGRLPAHLPAGRPRDGCPRRRPAGLPHLRRGGCDDDGPRGRPPW